MAHPLEKHVGKSKGEKGKRKRCQARDMLRELRARMQGPMPDSFFFATGKFASRVTGTIRSSEKNNKNSFLSFRCPLFEALAQVAFRSICSAVTFCSTFNDKM